SAKLNAVGSYRIYGGASAQVLAAGTLSGGDRPLGMMYANVAVGDLDGDSTKEIIFAGRQDVQINSCNVIAANWDESISNLAFWSKGKSIPVNGNDWGFHPIPPLVAFNPQLTRASDHGTPDTLLAWNSILRCEAKNSDFTEGFKGLTSIGLPVYTNVFAADVNGDQRDELVSLSSVGGVGIEIFGLGTGNTFAVDTIPVTVGTFFTLGAADLTAQSLILRYTGTSVKYTNPKIIAVIASPPFYANAADTPAFGNAGTSLGMTSSASQTKANVFSVNANFSFGATANCPLWGDLGDLEIKYTFGASFSTGFERTTETSCTHRYTTLAGSDAVVYSCVPYDVYSYEVLHSPNANAIGTSVTVDIPRSPQVILMDKDLFNLIPENPLLVESSILTHSIGDPYTYMNLTQATALFTQNPKGLIDVEGINSPSGDNQVAESIVCITDSKGTSYGGGLSFTVSVEEVAFGALFGAEMGFSDEFTYTVQTSESTELSGAVPGSSLAENQVFKFGILGYQKTEPSLQATPFMVVSYWVGR
ncbi:MAG: hypothetical protein JW765_00020, partial [Deltaproteobacteria bacterium]|nr:hypothetical protein [Candidatus Zymogenaceae bacterium]